MSEPPPVPPYRWPGIWARDQTFWRDVASRTLAGLIVVGVTVLAGAAVGLIRLPLVALALTWVVIAVIFSAVPAWFFVSPDFTGKARSESKRLRRVLFVVFFALWSSLGVGFSLWAIREGESLRERCDTGIQEACL